MFKPSLIALLAVFSTSLIAGELEPGEPFDYPSIAFYPDRWEKKDLTAPMTPWVGEEIVLVTPDDSPDRKVIGEFVGHLDRGWALYREIVGKSPKMHKAYAGKPTIAILPAPGLSCGYGCGYVGSTGIEMSDFKNHYRAAEADPLAVPHAYFYEIGRNFFVYRDRHSCFTTGFAVFMRYVCMDSLDLHDSDKRTRKTIDDAIGMFEKNDMSFLDAMTSFGPHGEKGNRLRDEEGKEIVPSDQNVLYASLMLQLSHEFGGNDFVSRFYQSLHEVPSIRPTDETTARKQCLSWLVCASVAAKADLTERFTQDWKLALDQNTIDLLGGIDWEKTSIEKVFEKLASSS
ncbi:MAG: calcium-binding protein [Verrucomicrobiales bacterium]